MRLDHVSYVTSHDQLADTVQRLGSRLGTTFVDEDNDTLAGFILKKLGRVPHKGESITIGNILFEVQRADARQVHVLLATKLEID